MASQQDGVDILLFGKAGSGKSATGNSILGTKDFKVGSSMGSVTTEFTKGTGYVNQTAVTVVDGPAIECKNSDGKSIYDLYQNLKPAFDLNPQGFHAIVFIVPYGERLQKEELDTIQNLKHVLGDKFMKNHGVLIITQGDRFERDLRDEQIVSKRPFDKWLEHPPQADLNKIVHQCNGRVLLFNNHKSGKDKIDTQRAELIKLVIPMAKHRFQLIPPKTLPRPSNNEDMAMVSDEPMKTMNDLGIILQHFDRCMLHRGHGESFDLKRLLEQVQNILARLRSEMGLTKHPSHFIMMSLAQNIEMAIVKHQQMC